MNEIIIELGQNLTNVILLAIIFPIAVFGAISLLSLTKD